MARAVAHDEHLDREHADIAERLRDRLGDAARLRGNRERDGGRHARGLQDMVLMLVFGHVEAFDAAVASARRDDGNLALERHEGFENLRLPAEMLECGRIGAVTQDHLPLAVIAESAAS